MPTQESLTSPTIEEQANIVALGDVCPVCGRWTRGDSVSLATLEPDVAKLINANSPATTEKVTEACGRCARLFTRAKDQIIADAALKKDGSHVLSTPLRLDADERFTGKGVTIAFLDSGFYPHPDLTERIVAYRNLTDPDGDVSSLLTPDVASWHGMMTSVVAAGNGSLSNGFYRGIAPDASVVLVKLAKTGRISDQNIFDGLTWVLEHRETYDIKVVNISAGGDDVKSYLHDPVSQLVEECSRLGITIVCAVGNAGHLPTHPVFAPASAPSAIAVGGLDDQNSLNRAKRGMYRSSYGPTIDGLQKPEVIASSIWVPAPILPGTPTAQQAELLEMLDKADDSELYDIIRESRDVDPDLDAALDRPVHLIRQIVAVKLVRENVINKHYKYVDGTSFAAPIVSSVCAQMLEADPTLTPSQLKRILIDTAERLPGYEVDRQGWGVIDPRRALEAALEINRSGA